MTQKSSVFPLRSIKTLLVLLPVIWGISIVSAAVARVPVSQPTLESSDQLLLAQEGIQETVLFFETESMAVRIYRRGEALFMNLYNKNTNIVEVNGASAELVPNTRDQTVYKNSLGEAERFARINVLGETELEIVASDGTPVLQEVGYNTVVGVSPRETPFQGNNFAPGTGAVVLSAQYANLRSNPWLETGIIGPVPRRAIVDVIDRVGNPEDGFIWYEVLYEGSRGWIRGDLLQPA